MLITEMLAQNAQLYPDDIALVTISPKPEHDKRQTWRDYNLIETNKMDDDFRTQMTWKEFDIRANRFANLLRTRGIKKGDKVAILLMNCSEWLPIYFGILRMGALAVPLNYRYTAEEVKYCLDLSQSSALIFGPEFTGRVESIVGVIPDVKSLLYVGSDAPMFSDSYEEMIHYCIGDCPDVPLTEDDLAAIYFSSGTTGFPKAIVHAHRALTHAAVVEQAHHGQTRDDVFLCIPPLYHTGAKMHWFGSLLSGSRAVLLKGATPAWIMRTASEEKCSIVWLLVPWAQDLLDAVDRGELSMDDYDLTQWRLMHIGAQPVPTSLIRRWKALFPYHQYDTNYGLSESIGPGCVHLGVENIHKVGAIGVAGHGWQVRIVDENRQDVAPGDVGELAVAGAGVMLCYFNDEKSTREAMDDKWLYTGDMAQMDEDGFIYLVDRKKDVIISGGENLYPVQIENYLAKMEQIKDVAVIGLPDKRLGEIATAIVEVKQGATLTEEEIAQFCAPMPRYKRPRKIIFAPVPRNPTGKIEKPKLRQTYAADGLVAQQFNT